MKSFYTYILFCFVFFVSACDPIEKNAPITPTTKNSSFNFSYFSQSHQENTNFSFVSDKVLGWETFIEDTIAVHNLLIKNTEQYKLSYQKENTWLSAFSFNFNEVNYSTKFFGVIDIDTVLYKGFVSFDTISDFLLLDGKIESDAKIGTWVFNEGIEEDYELKPVKLLSISWDFSKNKHIKFTINQAGSKNLDYLSYIDSVDNEYDAYLDVYSNGNENHTIIQWNKANNEGRVKDMLKFDNENWHYWNSDLQDISKK